MDPKDSDEQLMQRYAGGDHRAFERLYTRHKGGLYRYLLRQIGRRESAEEIYQDVWAQVIKHRLTYKASAKFVTYLFHIAHNRVIDFYRAHKRGLPLSYVKDPGGQRLDQYPHPAVRDPQRQTELNRAAADILDAIAGLPEAQRETWLLKEEGDLSVQQIADVTGVSPEAAKSRLRYANHKLREQLQEVVA